MPEHYYLSFAVSTQPHKSIDYHHGDTISRHGDYSIGSWADDSHHESFVVYTALPEMQSDKYDEDYHIEKIIEYHGLAMDVRGLLHTSLADAKSTSIDSNINPSINAHQKPDSELHVKENTGYGYLTPDEFGIFRDPEGQARVMDGRILNISKDYIADIIAMNGSSNFLDTENKAEDPPSIYDAAATSIDDQFHFRRSTPIQNRKRKPRWESRDEHGVYRDEDGFARAEDGRIIHVSKEDTRAILQGAAIVGHTRIGLPEYAEVPIPTVPDVASFSKAEIDEMVAEIYRVLPTSDDYHSKRLDDIYYPFNNSISWLTTRTDEMKQDIAMIQKQHAIGAGALKSTDDHTQPSIDARTRT